MLLRLIGLGEFTFPSHELFPLSHPLSFDKSIFTSARVCFFLDISPLNHHSQEPPPPYTHTPIRFLKEMVKHVEGIIFIINSYRPGYAGWVLLRQWTFFFLSSILHFINIPRSALDPLKKSGMCLGNGKSDLVLSCWLTIGYHPVAIWYIFNLDVL